MPDILAEHLEELAFLRIQRRALLVDFETTVEELAEHDERIAAHRDALAVGGEAAARLARSGLDDPPSPWELAACALVWVEEGRPAPAEVRAMLAAIDPADAETLAGWREAFRLARPDTVDAILPATWIEDDGPEQAVARAVRTDARGWHGLLDAHAIARAARDPEPAVRRAVARTGFPAPDRLAALADDPDAAVARAALWAWTLVARDAGLGRARARAQASPPDPFALRLLGVLGDPAGDLRLLATAAAAAGSPAAPAALRALGDLGHPAALPLLLDAAGSGDEACAAAALDALAVLLGPLGEGDEPPPPEALRALVEGRRTALGDAAPVRRGLPVSARPPADPTAAAEETTESRWRRALAAADPADRDWWREVPDGFLDPGPPDEAQAGA